MRFTVPAKRKNDHKNTSFILLAAGTSRRYLSKSLLNVNGSPFIVHQINTIRDRFGESAEIICVLGNEIDRVYKVLPRNVRVIENAAYETTTSAKSAALGLMAVTSDNAYLIHGDIIFNENVFKGKTTHLITFDSENPKVGLIENGGLVSNMSYGLKNHDQWAEIAFLENEDMNKFIEIYSKNKNINPHIHEIINGMIENGSKVKSIKVGIEDVSEINNNKDIALYKIGRV